MDAGSDRVEVTLATHPAQASDEIVFELRIVDTGAGMDSTILDEDFTRLFASSKADDRTMAGGFGIGFVSVFAWQPEAVLVQTGRAGEAWELVFDAQRKFEQTALDMPLEGTTITLLRRGRDHERSGIAEAIRDSLWRWCRFCRLEVTFEDLDADEAPELIQDTPAPQSATLATTIREGDHEIHIAFAVPPTAVLLRRGLILAEGPPASLLPELAKAEPASVRHLQIWVDSPELRTTLARDKVVDGPGMARVTGHLHTAIPGLRERLLSQLEAAAAQEQPHPRYAHLHAHLRVELAGDKAPAWLNDVAIAKRPIVRGLTGGPWSLADLHHKLPIPVAVYGPPDLLKATGNIPSDDASVLAIARTLGFPVIAAEFTDLPWLEVLLDVIGLPVLGLHQALWRVPIAPPADPRLAALVTAVELGLREAGLTDVRLALGHYGPDTEHRPTLVGLEVGRDDGHALVLHAHTLNRRRPPQTPQTLWLDDEDAMLRAAAKLLGQSPESATLALACTIAAQASPRPPSPETLHEALQRHLPPPPSDSS